MKIIAILLLTATFFIINIGNNMAQNIRHVRDNVGFCWRAADMDKLINFLAENDFDKINLITENLVAAISPHDDYLYAAKVYYPLYKLIKTKEVVIFGVTHGTVRKAMNDPKNILIFDDYDFWQGPYKPVSISPLREVIKSKLNKDYYNVSDKAQSIEHSIEALIPFLQYYNRDIKITPIMVTEMSFTRMDKISSSLANIITEYVKSKNLKLGSDIFFLISTDANHYGKDFNNSPYGEDEAAHKTATENDKRIAAEFFNNIVDKSKIKNLTYELLPDSSSNKIKPLWCGRYPVPFGLLTVDKIVNNLSSKKLTGVLLKYSDTWTEGALPLKHTQMGLTAPFSLKHWVGFLSAAFYLNNR